jgi:hypothetical protein
VTTYGANGGDSADDAAAVRSALSATAAAGKTLYFPAGTYMLASKVIMPAGAHLAGAGQTTTRLSGAMEIAGNSAMTDLTVGADGSAFRFVTGAQSVAFTRVTFVGGGGMTSGENQGVIRFSGQRSAGYVSFVDCTVGANSADGNSISMASYGWSGGTYHHITFERVHFLSSPRMTFEAIQRSDGTHATTDGYDHLDFTDCMFEPSGSETLSFDCSSGRAGDSTISGCTFKGSGTNGAYAWGQTIEFNKTLGMTFSGNTVYRSRGAMINFQGDGATPTETVIRDNTFDNTVDNGGIAVATTTQMIYMNEVAGARFTGNLVKGNAGGGLMYVSATHDNLFSGNTWRDARTASGSPIGYFATGSSGNTFDGERFECTYRYGTLTFKTLSDQNTVRNSRFVNGTATSISKESGLTVNLSNNTDD